MKRTIFVVYTNGTSKGVITNRCLKRYAFNTESEVSVGDIIESKDYESRMVVVKVLTREYKYYDRITGVLSNKLTSTGMYDIKDIKIVENVDSEMVVASKIGSVI